MLVVVTCPKCSKQSNVPDSNVGRRIRCSGCQAIFLAADESAPPPSPPLPPRRAAGPPPLPQQYDPAESFEEPAPEATPVPAPLEPAAEPRRLGFWAAVVLVGILMVACGILAAVYLNKK
jgi:hypothetical protein